MECRRGKNRLQTQANPPSPRRIDSRLRRRWRVRGRRTRRRAWMRPTARSTPPSAAPPTPCPSCTRRPWPSRNSPSRPASATPSCVQDAPSLPSTCSSPSLSAPSLRPVVGGGIGNSPANSDYSS
jgi:hypothetical protein